MDKFKVFSVLLALILLTIFAGCIDSDKEVSLSNVYLKPSEIKSGETTQLWFDAENSGDREIHVKAEIFLKNPRVKRLDNKKIEGDLNPGESLGKRYFELTGTCDSIECKYEIRVILKADGRGVDEKRVVLTVKNQ